MKMKVFALTISILVLGLTVFSCKKTNPDKPIKPGGKATEYVASGNTITITDHGEGTGNKTLTADKIWVLNRFVFVNKGQTLTIEPGTIIKAKPGQGENASALIVARGAKIRAVGTVQKPIIFTAEADDLKGSVSRTARGLWGGLILLGNAKINTVPNKKNIEGIPTTEPRGEYGGSDDHDNSGVLKYISIRHGGTNIGANNEINGLTFGAIGDGTTVEHIEVYANNDDGYEWFGGTVHTKWLISAYCKDDAFDWDQGYTGKGQFWLGVQDPDSGDRLGELDGADLPEDGTPLGGGTVYNATLIGRGVKGTHTLTFRANGGGFFYNCIFVNQHKGVDIELKENLNASSSYKRFKEGQLKVENNIFYDIADNTNLGIFTIKAKTGVSSADKITAENELAAYISGAHNTVDVNPGLTYPTSGNFSFNAVPTINVSNNMAAYPSDFESVNYKGAIDPNGINWAKSWTLLYH